LVPRRCSEDLAADLRTDHDIVLQEFDHPALLARFGLWRRSGSSRGLRCARQCRARILPNRDRLTAEDGLRSLLRLALSSSTSYQLRSSGRARVLDDVSELVPDQRASLKRVRPISRTIKQNG